LRTVEAEEALLVVVEEVALGVAAALGVVVAVAAAEEVSRRTKHAVRVRGSYEPASLRSRMEETKVSVSVVALNPALNTGI
jgi:hypothetical protein